MTDNDTTADAEWADALLGSFEQCETADAAILQAMGAASMCWERVDRAGVFESHNATVIAAALASHLYERWGIPQPPARERLLTDRASGR